MENQSAKCHLIERFTRFRLEGEAGVAEGAPVEAAALPAQEQRLGEPLLRDPEPGMEIIPCILLFLILTDGRGDPLLKCAMQCLC